MNKKIISILSIFEKYLPIPKTELNYSNNFQLLIATVLSAQSTDIKVNKVTKELFKDYGSPKLLYFLGLKKIKKKIFSLGLYNKKSFFLIKICSILIKKYRGNIPHNRKLLQNLPGVGRKVAGIILNKVFKKKIISVDTHVFRVSKRLNIVSGNTLYKIEKNLIKVIPDIFIRRVHDWFVLHGRYICKSLNPLCEFCMLYKFCDYSNKNF